MCQGTYLDTPVVSRLPLEVGAACTAVHMHDWEVCYWKQDLQVFRVTIHVDQLWIEDFGLPKKLHQKDTAPRSPQLYPADSIRTIECEKGRRHGRIECQTAGFTRQ